MAKKCFENMQIERGNLLEKVSPLNFMQFKRLKNGFLFIFLFFLLFGGCSRSLVIRNEPEKYLGWNMFGGDHQHTNSISSALDTPLKLEWKFKTSSSLGLSPIISNGIIYAATLDGKIEAFDVLKGNKRGRIRINVGIVAAPIIHKGRLYFATSKKRNTIFCYDISKGRYFWRKNLGFIESSPVIYEEKLFVGNLVGKLYCLDSENGEIVWEADTDDSIYSSPTIWGNSVIIGTIGGKIYSFDIDKGDKLWEKGVKGSIFASPSINNGNIFVGTTGNIFYAVDVKDGKIKWEFKTKGKIYSTSAVNENIVLFGCNDKFLYAVNQENGELMWKFNSGGLINTSPVIAGNNVYFGSLNHNLYGLDLNTGELKWTFKTSGRIKSSPIIYKNYLVASSENRELFVFSGNN